MCQCICGHTHVQQCTYLLECVCVTCECCVHTWCVVSPVCIHVRVHTCVCLAYVQSIRGASLEASPAAFPQPRASWSGAGRGWLQPAAWGSQERVTPGPSLALRPPSPCLPSPDMAWCPWKPVPPGTALSPAAGRSVLRGPAEQGWDGANFLHLPAMVTATSLPRWGCGCPVLKWVTPGEVRF